MNDAIESTINYFIVLFLIILDALTTLLSGVKKGVLKDEIQLPAKKSASQLNKMLKKDLIDLVMVYQS